MSAKNSPDELAAFLETMEAVAQERIRQRARGKILLGAIRRSWTGAEILRVLIATTWR